MGFIQILRQLYIMHSILPLLLYLLRSQFLDNFGRTAQQHRACRGNSLSRHQRTGSH